MNILIISMSTWGELGNWLSGKTLSDMLQTDIPDAQITQIKAESVYQHFASIGLQIKSATLAATDPEARQLAYCGILEKYENHFESLQTLDLSELKATLSLLNPDVVIGTKGVICRICIEALRQLHRSTPVVNYVTNHGHFRFKIHHCVAARLHLVRFPESKDYLLEHTTFDSTTVLPVGYLLNTSNIDLNNAPLASNPTASSQKVFKPSVVVMSNRGGVEYLKLLEHFLLNFPHVKVAFLSIKDEELYNAALKLVRDYQNTNCNILRDLNHQEFLELLVQYKEHGPTIYVSKASPNAIFEAVYLKMPMLLVRSGLPMEDWAAEKVLKEGLGLVYDSISDVINSINLMVNDVTLLNNIIDKQHTFKQNQLSQDSTRRQIRSAVSQLFSN